MVIMDVKGVKRKALPILKKYKVSKAGVFGSIARGNSKKGSDIDILVKLGKELSLFGFVGLKLELEKALGRKVDLVEYDSIKPALKEIIAKEAVRII